MRRPLCSAYALCMKAEACRRQPKEITVRAFVRSRVVLMANQERGHNLSRWPRSPLSALYRIPAVLQVSQSEDGMIQRDKYNHVSFIHTTRMK